MTWPFPVLPPFTESAPFTFMESLTNTTDGSSFTFSNVAFGAAATGRLIVVTIGTSSSAATVRTISSATIGGVAATVNRSVSMAAASFRSVHVISAVVPTGTTGSVVVNWSGTMTRMAIAVYRGIPLSGSTPHATNSAGDGSSAGVTSRNITLGIKAGGFAVFAGSIGNVTTATASNSGSDTLVEYLETSTSENAGTYASYAASTTQDTTATLTMNLAASNTLVIAGVSWY